MSARLLVLALGGHGLSRPNEVGYSGERGRIDELRGTLAALAEQGFRLLIVHGNGPQVGRLLGQGGVKDLDIHTAQTQGELGYLLTQALPAPAAALLTRVEVAAELGPAVKPIGAVHAEPPKYTDSVAVSEGFRIAVPSPLPQAVVEYEAIRVLLAEHHVVAGGGGGVPLTAAGAPADAVIDKDWVAALLACALDAELLVFATDVAGVYADLNAKSSAPIAALDVAAAQQMLAAGMDAGSMAPKLGSAVRFVEKRQRAACICAVEDILATVAGQAGTKICG